ncbi:MAG TPA: hypothetical protein VMU48_09200 [Terracidiphilus sp.]|nr:hypothetical protein [Terracidiphilus sp.]
MQDSDEFDALTKGGLNFMEDEIEQLAGFDVLDEETAGLDTGLNAACAPDGDGFGRRRGVRWRFRRLGRRSLAEGETPAASERTKAAMEGDFMGMNLRADCARRQSFDVGENTPAGSGEQVDAGGLGTEWTALENGRAR